MVTAQSKTKSPSDQFQIGDQVLYVPEGVVTRINGYRWQTDAGKPPHITTYVLDCGVNAVPEWIKPHKDAAKQKGAASS